MSANTLEKLYEHNNWANQKTLQACAALSDAQLDAAPHSATKGTIRATLEHLVRAQHNYLALLTRTPRLEAWETPPSFAELEELARSSGEGLLALTRSAPEAAPGPRLQTRDGYFVEPWVVMVQAINHATEHREQINSMLTALGITPPDLDGWSFGEASGGLTQP